MNSTSQTGRAVWPATLRETTVLLATAALVPFLVHLIPWGGPRPLGAYLLPLYWAVAIAVYFRGAFVGLAAGLVALALNIALTRLPSAGSFAFSVFEMAAFVAAAALLFGRSPRFFLGAPLAFLAANALTLAVQWSILDHVESPAAHWLRTARGGLAGLAVLALINLALVRFYPRPAHALSEI